MSTTRELSFLSGFWFDALLRTILAVVFIQLEKAEPFTRKIHEDELWLYKNPHLDSYVPTIILWPLVFGMPVAVIFIAFLIQKDRTDFYHATLTATLALGLNGVITDIIKVIVGRPRPDFFWRCFPDGQLKWTEKMDFVCTGDKAVINDGRKSFPSGHSSFAFASFGFIALYLAGKFHTFSLAGKGKSWKLCTFFIPICSALAIALSRTCDYHHHWQDVMVGSMIGASTTYICYRHYYPPLDSQVCHKPYSTLVSSSLLDNSKTSRTDQMKWI